MAEDVVILSRATWNEIRQMLDDWKRKFPLIRPRQRRRSAAAGSSGGVVWAIVTQFPEYNDPEKAKFVVQKASIAAVAGNDVWQGDGADIEITRAIGHEGSGTAGEDIRNWAPWPAVGSIVKIIARETIITDTDQVPPVEVRQSAWLLDFPIMFGGDETESSFRADPDTGAAQAVWA